MDDLHDILPNYEVLDFIGRGGMGAVYKLPPAEAVRIALAVCDALACAHAQGVVHRDIKPANARITREGRAKLADFGLARPDEDLLSRVTKTRRVMGTADNMAPEHRADLFSLGVMLYEMLTGHTPRGNWPAPSEITSADGRGLEGAAVQCAAQGALQINSPDLDFDLLGRDN